jgi:hypothetical protein
MRLRHGHLARIRGVPAFVVDTPWSAVFVSFAYVRAGVPGFAPSASHYDFARQAIADTAFSPFRFADPDVESPAAGDLLCFTRGLMAPLGVAGFRTYLEGRGSNALAMHCDIVVAANAGGDGKLYTVGGNVLQGVTMRTLPSIAKGRSGTCRAGPRRLRSAGRTQRSVQLRSPGLGGAAQARTQGVGTAAGARGTVLHALPAADAGGRAAVSRADGNAHGGAVHDSASGGIVDATLRRSAVLQRVSTKPDRVRA